MFVLFRETPLYADAILKIVAQRFNRSNICAPILTHMLGRVVEVRSYDPFQSQYRLRAYAVLQHHAAGTTFVSPCELAEIPGIVGYDRLFVEPYAHAVYVESCHIAGTHFNQVGIPGKDDAFLSIFR